MDGFRYRMILGESKPTNTPSILYWLMIVLLDSAVGTYTWQSKTVKWNISSF